MKVRECLARRDNDANYIWKREKKYYKIISDGFVNGEMKVMMIGEDLKERGIEIFQTRECLNDDLVARLAINLHNQ